MFACLLIVISSGSCRSFSCYSCVSLSLTFTNSPSLAHILPFSSQVFRNINDAEELKEIIRAFQARFKTSQRKYQLLSKVGKQLEGENLRLSEQLVDSRTRLRYMKEENNDLKDSLEDYRSMVKLHQERELHYNQSVNETRGTYKETRYDGCSAGCVCVCVFFRVGSV